MCLQDIYRGKLQSPTSKTQTDVCESFLEMESIRFRTIWEKKHRKKQRTKHELEASNLLWNEHINTKEQSYTDLTFRSENKRTCPSHLISWLHHQSSLWQLLFLLLYSICPLGISCNRNWQQPEERVKSKFQSHLWIINKV